jgi:hypothetical protein
LLIRTRIAKQFAQMAKRITSVTQKLNVKVWNLPTYQQVSLYSGRYLIQSFIGPPRKTAPGVTHMIGGPTQRPTATAIWWNPKEQREWKVFFDTILGGKQPRTQAVSQVKCDKEELEWLTKASERLARKC